VVTGAGAGAVAPRARTPELFGYAATEKPGPPQRAPQLVGLSSGTGLLRLVWVAAIAGDLAHPVTQGALFVAEKEAHGPSPLVL